MGRSEILFRSFAGCGALSTGQRHSLVTMEFPVMLTPSNFQWGLWPDQSLLLVTRHGWMTYALVDAAERTSK